MSQNARDRAMSGFRARRYDVLVATDIAARGIDVAGVSHVINFDVPMTPEAYTHRIGRTGRAERDGVACTFVTGEDTGWVRATERMIGTPIPRRRVEGFDPRTVVIAEPIGRAARVRHGDAQVARHPATAPTAGSPRRGRRCRRFPSRRSMA